MGNHATKASKDKKDVILHQIKPNMVSKTSADIKCMSVNRCPFSKQVKNYQDGLSHQDTLHHRAVKSQVCMSNVCEGSIMTPKALMRCPSSTLPDSDDILMQAIDFINQYYKSIKNSKIEEHLSRVEEVAREIDATGSYQLTTKELEFGAKQAWRNAPRCIGRIQWANLQLFDARKCRTTEDMFQMLCDHIQFATNGGNLRSVITVFPQRTDGQHDFRVWNSQLIRYAGYKITDGTIIGDPASVDFTEMCIQLGWIPKYGLFDVLPLVLQANGEDPQLFEIPQHLILEVPIEHPQYEWFKDLNLRWYTLPAVSNMLLEIGGLEFPACPFNGWYMGTEIGVRDFCDTQRYNVLERVGRRMGLETQKLSSLWKDQALVAINVAVMHSFQKNKVTITDHHSASESFMQHMEMEVRLRGGCPADWVWLVPPMSGSLTPVYHQEMLNYILSPFFYYQPDPWLTYKWKDKRRWRRCTISFKGLIRVVLFSQTLIKSVLAKRVRCTILYATETGKSQTFAKKLNAMMNCAFSSMVVCMEDYNFSDLDKESLLIVVTSTFGNGDCPGNGESFKKQLFTLKSLRNKVRFCVFGLGSRSYSHFCGFAHAVDDKLAALGAIRVSPTGEGDELNGQEEAFSAWACTAFKDACKAFNIQGQLPGSDGLADSWDPQRHRVQNDSCTLDQIAALSALHSKAVVPMKLKRRQNLQSPESSQSTILVVLEMDGNTEPLNFAPGDHVRIFPGNSPELVAGILKHLPSDPPINQSLRLEFLNDSYPDGERWQRDERIPPCPLVQSLTYYLDVTSPPSQSFLRKLSKMATQEDHRQRLLALATDLKVYTIWKEFHKPTFLEVLEEFSSVELSAEFLLSQLPLLKPRLYSISSSPDLHPQELHLTVAVVSYHTQEGKGPQHFGLCSAWLNTIEEGHMVPCCVHSSDGFHLPSDPSAPCILVGAGSGIAPFRGFWQQRFYDMKKTGLKGSPMTLVFGCRDSDTDHLYKEETLDMRDNGILSNITTAYSRQTGKPKVYVQDILREQLNDKVFEVLHHNPGHLYICGGINMAQDVAATIQEILVRRLGITLTQAEEYLSRLKNEKRYHEDIFGS
ncbi:nitric oxide synthase 2b, inducible [Pimephales promelas]|uniref:nitric oxide synthase 2b, inducible n=1 Tax=Pimephales promelas TaxID=90988 RepID=UPI001955E257|nr:nitric oxide synthase 2b, inducible [Pimephales promelas]XP_039518839.1 nitric oxide synthase 2b, inducible [Pimephales promelas]KAG1929953.1 nitric oxide synthase, inducible isoform b [Pimephales promelas]KAG1929954.1 nitric oxide synthase, inducible isoform b [Pimephales promelas]